MRSEFLTRVTRFMMAVFKVESRLHTGLRWPCALVAALILCFGAFGGRAQTVLISEGFEGAFPNSWSVVDSPDPGVYWKDEPSSFGSVPAHSGGWKGYCAGIGYGGTSTSPTYTNNMADSMSQSVNLTGYTGANLSFWYNIPSIETFYDHFRVYVDATVVLDTNGATAGWMYATVPLNAYLGGTHTVRFELDSDVSVFYEGPYLDDIKVDAANQPVIQSMTSLVNANYSGYVLDSDTGLGRSNVLARTVFTAENFTGANLNYSNVLSYRLINASSGAPHPIYDFGNTVTNTSYTYNITNSILLAAGTNVMVTNNAFIRPAAWMNQFNQYYVECRMYTNGALAQTLTTAPATYYHFTNTVSGDPAYNVLLTLTNNAWSRTYAVQTVPGQNTFQANVGYQVRRWDDFNLSVVPTNVPVIFNFKLTDSGGNNVPLVNSNEVFYDAVNNYNYLFPFAYPTFVAGAHTLDVQPAGQLDSVSKTYYLTVTIGHTNNPFSGQVITANTMATPLQELLHFDGKLIFGGVGTTMNALGVPAPPVNAPSGGVIPTTLNGVGGYVTAKTDHTYTGGGPLSVNLQSNGDAIVTAGSVVLNGPSPDMDSSAGVNYQRGPVTLSSSGASATLTVTLPTGFGYRLSDTNSMVITPFVPYASVPLTASLGPVSDQVYVPLVPIYAVEECKPVWINATRIIWHVLLGSFDMTTSLPAATYVRAPDYGYLQSVSNYLVNPPAMAVKVSNDQYWLALTGMTGTPNIQADPNGNAWLSTTFNFGPSNFLAHFPYNNPVQWTGNGSMKVVDDLVVAGSTLTGVGSVTVPYARNCQDCGSSPIPSGTPTINPNGSVLNFTADGGLIAVGPTVGTVNLQWGYIAPTNNDYAQQAFLFSNAVFHLPGNFLRGDQNLLPPEQGATTILFSGFAGTNLNYVERPLSAGYTAGLADYAGMNFRCDGDSVHSARSDIAGHPNINWLLTGRSKYYVRPGGVTGIHEAVPLTFPSTLYLWGYQFNFSNYGLSYIDSHNDRVPATSLVNGLITLPAPANFVQDFNDMSFTCPGAPEAGDVPNGEPFKIMDYWGADFKTHSITFKSNDGCNPDQGYLVLGIEGYASHVPKPLYGEVGFFAAGDQIPSSFGLNGVTSRLKVPNVITVDGPTNTHYTFTPAQDGYYNTWSNRDTSMAGASAPGWMNIFGKMGVPFFEDLQLHLQTSCRTNGVVASNAIVYLSGGWPRPGSGNNNYGWDVSGVTPFETNLFDTANSGWVGPGGGVDLPHYRDNSVQNYHPRAQRLWLGIIDFDYPLEWNYPLRTFKSWEGITNELLVVSIQHQVTYMDPINCSLDFGAQYSGLPNISIANLAFNAIDEATGVAHAITEAASKPIEDALSTGLDEMNQLMDTQMKRMMDGVFDKTVDPVIDQFYGQLSNQWANVWDSLPLAQRQQFLQGVYSNGLNYFVGTGPGAVVNNLSSTLGQLGSGVSTAGNLITQIQTYIRDGTNAINSVISVVNIGTNGQSLGPGVTGLITSQAGGRSGIPKLATDLISDFASSFIDSTVGPAMSNLVSQAEPAFSDLTQTLTDTEKVMMQVSDELTNAGDFTAELSNILATATSTMSNISMQVTLTTTQSFGKLNFNIDNPFKSISAADIKQSIRQSVEDQFFASGPAAQIQSAMRQRLYDVDAGMRQQMDSVFGEINGVIKGVISQSLASIDDSISDCLGAVKDVMGAGSLKGHADICGDSLKLLRIDGHFQFKCPDNMELNAFLEIKELNSDGSDNGCGDAHNPFTEVTIGATKVPMNWISSGLTADLEAKFTFANQPEPLIDLGGEIALNGDINFQAFDLHDLAIAMAFGASDNYLALKGGVRFQGFDFSGAAFFGKTCTLDPLKLIDPDVASVLGNPPFTGGYVYAQGWIPVSQLLTGIPATCLFEISAGVGAGAFYFAEGPTFGGKMFLGVSGQLLCIVSIEGDITMIGVDKGGKVNFFGKGHFEASLGPCPICISISKDVSITYIDNSWNIQ